jgi:L-aminopeptidase/D-esterase-like protein
MRGGFGAAIRRTPGGAHLCAFAVVNAFGDVCEPGSTRILAGVRESQSKLTLANCDRLYEQGLKRDGFGGRAKINGPNRQGKTGKKIAEPTIENTTLIALVTTADLDVLDAKRISQAAILGLADAVRPACTIFDGDLAIAASIGTVVEDVTALAVIARQAAAEAIVNAVKNATPTAGLPAWSSLKA